MIGSDGERDPVSSDAQGQVVRTGDVVRLDPERHVTFGGCLLTVSQVAGWGVVGSVAWPDAPATARACYRAERGTFRRVGDAAGRTPPATEAA